MLGLFWATVVKTVAIFLGVFVGACISLCIALIFGDISLTVYEKFTDWRNKHGKDL